MHPLLAEFIGTALLILFGNGVVANVLLARTKGHGSGWIVITAGWAFAVFIGAFCASPFSGAHLNPAVTLAMACGGKLVGSKVVGYMAAQFAGAFLGGSLVYIFYREHFKATAEADLKLACFCTTPNIRSLGQSFFCEMLGTFVLVFPIFLMTDPVVKLPNGSGGDVPVGLGTIGLIPVALLVFGIGLSLGGTTGYAINPARDLGPRLAHALLPIPGKRDSDWSYAWVPIFGPLAGGLLAVLLHNILRG
jgi:glycerol uptake facilitator protein